MDYSQGYTSSFYMTIIDPISWADLGRIEIISGSINRSETDLRQSASLTLKSWDFEGDQWIRVYMVSEYNGNIERVPLFTGIATSPSTSYSNGVSTVTIQAYSVLKPAQDIILQHGWYARRGISAETIIRDLLSVTHAPIVVNYNGAENRLADDLVAEDNESNASMLEWVLDAMSWVMYIDGDGTIVFDRNPEYSDEPIDPVVTMAPYENDVIETSFTINHDWFECPNALRATVNEMTAVAKDEDPDSPLSIQNRGREVWVVENNVDLLDDETIAEYAKYRLGELQERYETVSYNRRFLPNVNVTNKIRLGYPELSGDFIIESQTITLGHAAVTQEQIKRSV